MKIETIISKIILLWIFILISCIASFVSIGNIDDPFYHLGPNDNLFILGICVDTITKYSFVVVYCFLNCITRVLNKEILSVWMINVLQDKTNKMTNYNNFEAYELTIVTTLYYWFDFFMYINILLSQIDMFIVEVLSEIIISSVVSSYYIKEKSKVIEENKLIYKAKKNKTNFKRNNKFKRYLHLFSLNMRKGGLLFSLKKRPFCGRFNEKRCKIQKNTNQKIELVL